MLSIIPEKTRVILIGASEFPRDPKQLPSLPAVKNNIMDLAKIFSDSDIIGIPSENVIKILDEPKASDVQEKLAKICKEAADTLIVYYAGHGLVGKTSSELFLATTDTTESESEYNAIPFAVIRKAISDSSAKKKVLIVDSCFSGRALEIMGTETSLLQSNLDLKGLFAMASAPANQPAIAPKGEKYTAFSGQLIKVLNEGIENNKEEITLKELFESIRNYFRSRADIPDPQHANLQDADKIVIAHNRKFLASVDQKLEALSNTITRRLDMQEARIEELASLFEKTPQKQDITTDHNIEKTPLNKDLLSAFISLAIIILPAFSLYLLDFIRWEYRDVYGYLPIVTTACLLVLIEGTIMLVARQLLNHRYRYAKWFYWIFPSWYSLSSAFRSALFGVFLILIMVFFIGIRW